jgi:eukaryotic-like serine/threonine-protein kinase
MRPAMARYLVPTAPPDDAVPTGEILAGKYCVERVVGAGAMGVVVEVTQLEQGDRYALKFLRPSVARDPSAAARFVREAEAAGRIHNPHVVGISDVGELASGSPYLVMEFLRGMSLEERISGGKKLELTEACDLALQAAEGLAAAHGMGVIHRDIKPANLFITKGPDGASLLKIVDFGISKICEPGHAPGQNLTQTQVSIGSPLYMSPEQMRSARTADFRTDQWSLGVVLYRMATGHLPFEAESLPQLCAMVMEGDYMPLSTRCTELPALFVVAVERCIQHSPNERYADMAELALALRPFASPLGARCADRCQELLGASTSEASSWSDITVVDDPPTCPQNPLVYPELTEPEVAPTSLDPTSLDPTAGATPTQSTRRSAPAWFWPVLALLAALLAALSVAMRH